MTDRDELRALQEPLKQRYRDDPESALVTLAATGELDAGVACSVQTGHSARVAGCRPFPHVGVEQAFPPQYRGLLAVRGRFVLGDDPCLVFRGERPPRRPRSRINRP